MIPPWPISTCQCSSIKHGIGKKCNQFPNMLGTSVLHWKTWLQTGKPEIQVEPDDYYLPRFPLIEPSHFCSLVNLTITSYGSLLSRDMDSNCHLCCEKLGSLPNKSSRVIPCSSCLRHWVISQALMLPRKQNNNHWGDYSQDSLKYFLGERLISLRLDSYSQTVEVKFRMCKNHLRKLLAIHLSNPPHLCCTYSHPSEFSCWKLHRGLCKESEPKIKSEWNIAQKTALPSDTN